MATGGIQLIDTFNYSGKKFLDLRQGCDTLAELKSTPETGIPDGFTKYCAETGCWYEYNSGNEEWDDSGRWRKASPISESLSEEYIFAIVDTDDTLLFGITHKGAVVYDKGIPGEVKARLGELEGIRVMRDRNYVFALTDKDDNVLVGVLHDGEVVIPKGVVRVVTWEEYESMGHTPGTLYIIEGKGGRTEGAFINGRAVTAGEEYAFMRDANLLVYHGRMHVLPKIWIDHAEMRLMVEYPSGYSGPLFVAEDGMLFLI